MVFGVLFTEVVSVTSSVCVVAAFWLSFDVCSVAVFCTWDLVSATFWLAFCCASFCFLVAVSCALANVFVTVFDSRTSLIVSPKAFACWSKATSLVGSLAWAAEFWTCGATNRPPATLIMYQQQIIERISLIIFS